MNQKLKELYEFAKEIVYQAGQELLQLKEKPLQLEMKKDHADLVTIADKKTEEFLVSKIIEKYPNHGILGEEGTFEKNPKDFETLWVIDPIDGTTNFIHGFPFYGISVGIVHKEVGIIGVVYNPSTDELFHACKGFGAFVNDKQLQIKETLTLPESVFSTTMFWENVEKKDALHPAIIELYKQTRGMRMVGGAAISLCEMAKGTLSAYIMPMLSSWDYAGGVIVLQEAGGVATRLNGEEVMFTQNGGLLASHPAVHKELLNKFMR